MTLIDPLLKTTRSPLWVHPLIWSLNHLDQFDISVQQINQLVSDPPNQKPTATSSGSENNPGRGFIRPRDLKYILQDIKFLEIYLSGFLIRTINTFQKSSRPKPFRFYTQEQRPKPPSPLFYFDKFFMQIHPELIVRTKKGLPFLMYNCAGRNSSLRRDFPKTPAGSDIEWRLKQTVVSLDFESEIIDPYDVSGLLALAQEQRGVFFRLSRPAPDILKVYFLSPHPSHAAVYLYTANIPLQYLDALHNPHLEVEKPVIITRQHVDLPALPTDGEKTITDGPFLSVLAQILGEALDFEKSRVRIHDRGTS